MPPTRRFCCGRHQRDGRHEHASKVRAVERCPAGDAADRTSAPGLRFRLCIPTIDAGFGPPARCEAAGRGIAVEPPAAAGRAPTQGVRCASQSDAFIKLPVTVPARPELRCCRDDRRRGPVNMRSRRA